MNSKQYMENNDANALTNVEAYGAKPNGIDASILSTNCSSYTTSTSEASKTTRSGEPDPSQQSSVLSSTRGFRGELDTSAISGMQSAVSRSGAQGPSRQSSVLSSTRGFRGESDTPCHAGNAATKVVVGTGGGPGQEAMKSRQSSDEVPCKAGRHIVTGVGHEQYHSSGDFDRSLVVGKTGLAKSSETKSLGQDISDHNDTGVMSSGRVACAQGQGVSEGSVQSEATDSTGLRASPPLWPYLTVSQNILPLSNGQPSKDAELITSSSNGSYTVEGLIAPCGKESSSSVMSVSKEPHFAQGRSHVRNSPGKTNQSYQESTGRETNDCPFHHLSGSDCLHRGSGPPLESRNRLTNVGKASSTPCESLPSGGLGGMKKSKQLANHYCLGVQMI